MEYHFEQNKINRWGNFVLTKEAVTIYKNKKKK